MVVVTVVILVSTVTIAIKNCFLLLLLLWLLLLLLLNSCSCSITILKDPIIKLLLTTSIVILNLPVTNIVILLLLSSAPYLGPCVFNLQSHPPLHQPLGRDVYFPCRNTEADWNNRVIDTAALDASKNGTVSKLSKARLRQVRRIVFQHVHQCWEYLSKLDHCCKRVVEALVNLQLGPTADDLLERVKPDVDGLMEAARKLKTYGRAQGVLDPHNTLSDVRS